MLTKKAAPQKSATASSKLLGVRTRLDAQVRSKMVIETAFKAIARDGFEGLRTRDIARLAGINSATLHHHFPTKEDLIAAVADYLQERFRAEDTKGVEGESSVDALERQLRNTIFYYRHRPEMLAVYREFVGRAPRDPMIRKLVDQLHAGWQADVVETLKRGVGDGSFRADLDLESAGRIIVSTVWGLIAHIFSSRRDFETGFHELMKWLVVNPDHVSPTKRDKASERTNVRGAHLNRNTESHPINQVDVDFGTYHHSTPEESKAVRARAEEVFSQLLLTLYPSDAHLRILDAGCGLGFLMYVAAKCFPNASITGADLFKHGSVSDLSIDHAQKNMESLGIGSRTSFLKHDLTKPLEVNAQYDLVVSNVVFHNMGKKRFKAYESVFNVLKPEGFFVLGDLFPKSAEDTKYFRAHSILVRESDEGNSGPWTYGIKVLRKDR